MQYDLYVQYGRNTCSGPYASYMECMYTNVYVCIVTDICAPDIIGICGMYVAFEGVIHCWHIYGSRILIKS